MLRLLVGWAALCAFAFTASAGRLIIEGPCERGEAPLPPGGGTFAVDVYAENVTGVVVVQLAFEFADSSGVSYPGFLISTEGGDPRFGGLAVTYNEALFAAAVPLPSLGRRTAGLVSAEEVNVGARTWLMSINYVCSGEMFGTITIKPDPAAFTLAAGDEAEIPVDVVTGSLAIERGEMTLYVDDDAPGDPGPGDPLSSDPQEDGSDAHPYDSLQEAVDAAESGDTVIVRAGTYEGGIDVNGKSLAIVADSVQQRPTIDCGNQCRAFSVRGEGADGTLIRGFTIVNGKSDKGGAIYCYNAFCLIKRNVISGCSALWGGGGIAVTSAAAVIEGNRINGCFSYLGGGIYCENSPSCVITNNLVTGNTSNTGGGIASAGSLLVAGLNTIVGNRGHEYGGGIAVWGPQPAEVNGCILWANSGRQGAQAAVTAMGGPAEATFAYCCIEGGQGGTFAAEGCSLTLAEGNFDGSPEFAATGAWDDAGTPDDPTDDHWQDGDYRLAQSSSCIDTGDPAAEVEPGEVDVFGNPRLFSGRIDVGAVEYQGPAELYVDDDAPNDPKPNDPSESDPLEDGSLQHPFDSILEAVEYALDGDKVLVLDGQYRRPTDSNIHTRGKELTIQSVNGPSHCVVVGSNWNKAPAFFVDSGKPAVITGFTIRSAWIETENAVATITRNIFIDTDGSEIRCEGGSVVIDRNVAAMVYCTGCESAIITGNVGQVYCSEVASVTITRHRGRICCEDCPDVEAVGNIVTGQADTSIYDGGGMWFKRCGLHASSNLVAGNKAKEYGGGVYFESGRMEFINNTVVSNIAGYGGGGLACGGQTLVANCIIRDNDLTGQYVNGQQIGLGLGVWASGIITITYCNIEGGMEGVRVTASYHLEWRNNNIDADPLFVVPGEWHDVGSRELFADGDYHLQPSSPCIDAGWNEAPLPEVDLDANPRVLDGNGDGNPVVDMGAYEFNPSPAPPAIFYVDDDAPGDPAPGDTAISDPAEDGSAQHPFDAIQEAADAASNGDIVIVRDGTYTGQGNRNIALLYKSLTIRSENGPEECIIDCESAGRGFELTGADTPESAVIGFTITNGSASGGGGGIYCTFVSARLENNVITGCHASGSGGGVYCKYGTFVLTNNTIRSNECSQDGGGIYAVSASLIFTENTVDDNYAGPGLHGGGLYLDSCTDPEIRSNVISNNCAYCGGGAQLDDCDGATLSNNLFTANTAEHYSGLAMHDTEEATLTRNTISDHATGGGVYIDGASPHFVASYNIITGNAGRYGGGIWCKTHRGLLTCNLITDNSAELQGGGAKAEYSDVEIIDNVFSNNSASFGGGVYGGMVSNNLIVNNTATSSGGGLCRCRTITNNTIGFNTSQERGGGCYVIEKTSITNCILWANTAGNGGPQIAIGTHNTLTVNYCDIQGGRDEIFVPNNAVLNWGEGNIDADPLFADPSAGDYHLRSTGGRWDPAAQDGQGGWVVDGVHSPCIDRGDPQSDYSGELQPNGRRVNMGAYGGTPEASKSVPRTCTIVVSSWGAASVPVSGTPSGITPYSAQMNNGDEVTLEAPPLAGDCTFFRWVDAAGRVLSTDTTCAFILEASAEVTAVYLEEATTWYVDDNAPHDPGPGSPAMSDPSEDGSTSHPFDAIQEAVDAASDGHTVFVRDGTYIGDGNRDIDPHGKAIIICSARGPAYCTINCQSTEDNAHRAFVLDSGEDERTVIRGFTIKNGRPPTGNDKGAAIYCGEASPTIEGNVFTQSYAYAYAVEAYSRPCTVIDNTFINCGSGLRCGAGGVITGNVFSGNTGNSATVYGSSAVLSGNVFSDNARSGLSCYAETAIISDNTFSNNEASAIYLAGGFPILTGNTITDNEAEQGAGIYCKAYAGITGNTFCRNGARYGGCIYAGSDMGPIANNHLIDNSADRGAAVYCYRASADLVSNLIEGNTGSALYLDSFGGMIANCTIVGNTCTHEGAVTCRVEDAMTITNCIIRQNHSHDNYHIQVMAPQANSLLNIDHCNIEGAKAAVSSAVGTFLDWGDGNIDTDPRFVVSGYWQNDTWKSGDYRLQSMSPCIDAGDPAYVAGVDERDIAGQPRVRGEAIDIGAWEYQAAGQLFVDDNGPGDPAPGNPDVSDPLEDGSEQHPFDSIQEAIDAAPDGGTVVVRDGTYKGGGNCNIDFKGKPITVRSANGPARTTVFCGYGGRAFHFHSGEGSDSVLQGFKISACQADTGGGILIDGASPSIIENQIISCRATDGAGIACLGGSPTITGNTIRNNTATEAGGGIFCAADSAIVSSNTIVGNAAATGAGIACCEGSAAHFERNTIQGNEAETRGGAVDCIESAPAFYADVMTGNKAPVGAGLSCAAGSEPVVMRAVISENEAGSTGGALLCATNAAPILTNCLLCNNMANDGAGVFAMNADPVFRNNTIAANTGLTRGGGISAEGGSVAIRNCILCDDIAFVGAELALRAAASVTVDFSAIAGGTKAAQVIGAQLHWGEGNIAEHPRFVNAPAGDFSLAADSPCIDAGDPAFTDTTELDLAGWPRLRGTAVDMGAIEHQPFRELFVDDDAPDDPVPGSPLVSDPLEDGSPQHPFDSIQEAIDAAEDGEVVVARDGTYTGIGNYNIKLRGKAITVRSQNGPDACTIDCQAMETIVRRAFKVTSGERPDTVIQGFTITGAYVESFDGAIYCSASAPTITGNVITGNFCNDATGSYRGAAIYCVRPVEGDAVEAVITDNIITANCSGIVLNQEATATISGNTVVDNDWMGIRAPGPSVVAENIVSGNQGKDGAGIYGAATVVGNTVSGNTATGYGGGIYCKVEDMPAVISDNIVTDNSADHGGGIHAESFSLTISNNLITRNSATVNGGGLYCYRSLGTVAHNRIIANSAVNGAGGLYLYFSSPTVHHNLIADNSAGNENGGGALLLNRSASPITSNTITGNEATFGAGLFISGESCPQISNCIIWGNSADYARELACNASNSMVYLDYCDIPTGALDVYVAPGSDLAASNNIDADPLFADPAAGDYHLKSEHGRWDPAANDARGGWVYDPVTSPCIDAGNPASDYSNEPEYNGNRINLGMFGNTAEASLSEPSTVTIEIETEGAANTPISGTPAGTTPYTAEVELGSEVSLEAPPVHNGYGFICWQDTEGHVLSIEPTYTFIINDHTRLVVVYQPIGETLYVDDDAPHDPGPNDTAVSDPAENGTATHPFDSIQEAIDAAADGNAIIVQDGAYAGEGNRDINFLGKAIHLLSQNGPENCVVDCQADAASPHRGFIFANGEGEGALLEGFTITGAYSADYGGGVLCYYSSPVIRNNVIAGNAAASGGGAAVFVLSTAPLLDGDTFVANSSCSGGGLLSVMSSPAITHSRIEANTAQLHGGGLYSFAGQPSVTNTVIDANQAGGRGGGVFAIQTTLDLVNATIASNSAPAGGGVSCENFALARLNSSILWNNTASGPSEISLRANSALAARYSTVPYAVDAESGCSVELQTGNDALDPLFADAAAGDYHLRSTAGRWRNGEWVADAETSPCIDAGDPEADFALEPHPNFGRVNRGAYGNTPEASKSRWTMPGDVNDDCTVSITDLILVRNHLLENVASDGNSKLDVNNDGAINVLDLVLVRNRVGRQCQD